MQIFIQSCVFIALFYLVQSKNCVCNINQLVREEIKASNLSDALVSAKTGCSQVAVQNEVDSVFCSAVLIDEQYAITPGQCIFGADSESHSSTQIVAVDDLFVHQGYLSVNTRNDFNIGIIKLRQPVDCSSGNVCIACLPARSTLNLTNPCTATTWNVRENAATGASNTSARLQSRSASIMDQIDCENKLREDQAIQNDYRLSDSKFCIRELGNTTSCTGDLGDPLICVNSNQYEVIGLNTMGFSCFRRSLPSFYVRVSAFVDWIDKVMEKQQPNPATTFILPQINNPVIFVPVTSSATQNANVSLPQQTPQSSVGPTASVPRAQDTTNANLNQTLADTTSGIITGTNATANPTSVPVAANPSPVQTPVILVPHLNQTNGASSQHIAADGSLLQVSSDGSVQRQEGLSQNKLLTEVSPNVFQANIGGQAINLDLNTGPKIIFPTADIFFGNSQIRQKRQFLPLGSSFSVPMPTFNIPASDATYDHDTGRFMFRLPNKTTAFSSASFVPSSAEDIKQQIIDQQDKILAQIDSYQKNILVSLNGVFNNNNSPQSPTFDKSDFKTSGSGMDSRVTGNNGVPVPTVSETKRIPVSQTADTNVDTTTHAPWKSIYRKKSTQSPDSDDGGSAQSVQQSTASKSRGAPVNAGFSGSTAGRGRPAFAQGAAVANANSAGLSLNQDTVGTSVNSDTPADGSIRSALSGQNGNSQAAASFKGDRVQAQTKNTANAASSSVVASSNGR